MKVFVPDPNLHIVERVAHIGRVEFVNPNSLWIVPLDCDHGHALVAVVLVELFDALLIHLGDWAMVAGEDDDKNRAGCIVAELMNFAVHAREREVWRG